MPAPVGPRPLTRAQALENRAFLAALQATGNAHAAARATGIGRAKMLKRRATHPAFAARWDAALAIAQAALAGPAAAATTQAPRLVRLKSGKVQLRAHRPGRLTRAAEQAFLAALSASANVRLSARAAGFSHAAFYARAREHDGFAREMRLAIQQGYEALELALIDGTLAEAHADDDWRHNAPPGMPPMTPDQAIQLLNLHHRTAQLWGHLHHERRLPHETSEEMQARVATIWRAKQRRFREDDTIAAAARMGGGPSRFEPDPPTLPDLAQVAEAMIRDKARRARAAATVRAAQARGEPVELTANGKVRRRHAGKALFGGWRVE